EEAESARVAATNAVVTATSLLAEARRTAESESEGLGGQRAAAAAATERRRSTAAELRRMEAEYAELAARTERHRLELLETTERIAELQRSIADLEYQASTVAEERAREEQEIAALSARLTEARKQADVLAEQVSDLNRHAAEVRDLRSGIEVQRAEAHARLTFVRETCASELNQSLEELAREQPIDDDFDLDTAQSRVEELRARIEGFGAVNMMALE